MTSGEHELACRYAEECARTLLQYHYWERAGARPSNTPAPWEEHERAVAAFEAAFPRYEWTDFAGPALLDEIERTRP